MPRKRRLLIVNQNIALIEQWKKEMGVRFHVEGALSLEEAQYAIDQQPPFTLIAIESFEEEAVLHAVPFIRRLRLTYKRPIIAIAGSDKHQVQMIHAGCNASTRQDQLQIIIYDTLRMSWQYLPKLVLKED